MKNKMALLLLISGIRCFSQDTFESGFLEEVNKFRKAEYIFTTSDNRDSVRKIITPELTWDISLSVLSLNNSSKLDKNNMNFGVWERSENQFCLCAGDPYDFIFYIKTFPSKYYPNYYDSEPFRQFLMRSNISKIGIGWSLGKVKIQYRTSKFFRWICFTVK
jgi:hypothetical protein